MSDLADALLGKRRKFYDLLAEQAASTAPTPSWGSALARALQGGIAGAIERADEGQTAGLIDKLPGMQAVAPPPSIAAAPMQAPVQSAQPRPTRVAALPGMMPATDEAPARPMVPSTSKIIGDQEAIDAGLYEQPTKVAQAPPALPGNARPTPSTGIPPQPVQPMQTRQSLDIPAEQQALIRRLWANPETRAAALGLWQKYSNPPTWDKLDESTLFDKATGRTMPVAGFRSIVDPAERANFGIPPEDKRPYQVGPAGKLINPPAETRFTVDQRGESKFKERASALNAERFNEYVKGGLEAQQMIGSLNALRDIASRITTGKTAQITEALGPYAEALGVKIDGLDDLQAFKSIVSRMAPQMRPPGSGATSDFDLRTYFEALPGLAKTPAGNAIIANVTEALQRHRLAAAEIASRAMAEEITPREAEKQLRDLPDPMQLWREKRGTLPSAAAVQQLKSKYGISQ